MSDDVFRELGVCIIGFLLSRTRFCAMQDISLGDLLAIVSGGPSEVTKEVSQLGSQADDGMASAGQEWEDVFQTCVPMRRATNFVGYGRCCSCGRPEMSAGNAPRGET